MPQQYTYAGATIQEIPQQQPMIKQFQPAITQHPYQNPIIIKQFQPAITQHPYQKPPAAIMDAPHMLKRTSPPMQMLRFNQQIIQPNRPSKAIKIVNPNTMKEIDTRNLMEEIPSARSTPRPALEQAQQQFKQNVNGNLSATNNVVTVTPLVPGNDVTKTLMDGKPKPIEEGNKDLLPSMKNK